MTALWLGLLLTAAPAPAAPPEKSIAPVAVMPFKDLTGDPQLAWLSQGVAETMMVDLRKGSQLQVVEREQLHHALEELKLQGAHATDEASAARLGKMVGARTVVLGSYQLAGEQLRIVARFVDVETGVVREAAKVTGPVEEVFALQDQIVVKLAGTPFGDAVKRVKAKPKKTLQAYKLYAQSFTVMSDADRQGLLESALKEDPDFRYAADDLLELQDRIARLSAADQKIATAQAEAQRAKMKDPKGTAQERLTAAMQLVGQDQAQRRYRAGLRDTAWILASDLPDDETYRVRQFALFTRMNLYAQLKETALAMQVAENFMKTYPGSVYFQGAQSMLMVWSSERARQLEEDRTFPAKLELVRHRVADEQARAQREPRPGQRFDWQNAPCDTMESAGQHAAAAACLQQMLDHRLPDEVLKPRYDGVRVRLIREATAAGEFEVARRAIEQFQKDDPETALRFSMGLQLMALPAD
jgi:TolB-like protein